MIEETEESARWRASTAKHLMDRRPSDSDPEVSQHDLEQKLNRIFTQDLGYDDRISKAESNIKSMFQMAQAFKRKLMEQRAVWEMFIPNARKTVEKVDGDEYLDSDPDKKLAGKIWFVMKPGLIKRGTGQGTGFRDSENQTVIIRAFVELR